MDIIPFPTPNAATVVDREIERARERMRDHEEWQGDDAAQEHELAYMALDTLTQQFSEAVLNCSDATREDLEDLRRARDVVNAAVERLVAAYEHSRH